VFYRLDASSKRSGEIVCFWGVFFLLNPADWDALVKKISTAEKTPVLATKTAAATSLLESSFDVEKIRLLPPQKYNP
jgi:hypothetical protein